LAVRPMPVGTRRSAISTQRRWASSSKLCAGPPPKRWRLLDRWAPSTR